MSVTLLAPAAAIVVTLCVLVWSMHRIESEITALRASLRRSRAAGVAVDEFRRDATTTALEANRVGQHRADLRRSRRRSRRR